MYINLKPKTWNLILSTGTRIRTLIKGVGDPHSTIELFPCKSTAKIVVYPKLAKKYLQIYSKKRERHRFVTLSIYF